MTHYVYRGNPSNCSPCSSGANITVNGGGSMSGNESIVNINGDGYGGGQINLLATNIDIVGSLTLTNYPDANYLYTNSDGYIEIGPTLGGDLLGNLPNPLVVGLYGYPISPDAPIIGDALVWNGSVYAPAVASGGGGDFIAFLLMGA